ncbi:Uncharacterized protein OS=Flavobacterium enshiense DK69 GN=Q767_15575 PE=4 SV=1: Reg_prop [Gemmata massiliana]|uniref:Uncharacterized protein n=1 Tax=Gemmata massiliana TaxID=1210884 RepID=A0A6P2DHT8_9BACT|nr:two-component regulator propeller domain-containing protein [Gemmata massiliana]VTS01598.1 Uncharacterized protein OS=Flavobacterium enshiense DK69 GN=Q767_15575 PE=4 SV=1: Reg_prop [Gemmata massiliana]
MPLLGLRALILLVSLSATAAAQDKNPEPKAANGEAVSELGKNIMYVMQAKNDVYWFGSNDSGVYRYDGKTLVNFTTKDGLVSNQIRGVQEDKSGHIYFTTYEGISRFDGRAFTTLTASEKADPKEWKLRPDDLWFVGPQDSGVVFRYDGTSLHRLAIPKTKIGEEWLDQFPRTKFPNARSNPYDAYTIVKDRKGNLWIGTANAGAGRFDGDSFRWLYEDHLTNVENGGSFGIRSIHEDKSGAFWICNTRYRFGIDAKDAPKPEKGMLKYKREKGFDVNASDGSDRVYFMSVVEDAKGVLWMATYNAGVWRYDGESATRYPVKDGAKEITLFAVYKDNRGDLWLGTHKAGAYKFNGKTFEKWRP